MVVHTVGSSVTVTKRTKPGYNNQGGDGTVIRVGTGSRRYDVRFTTMGGSEKGIEPSRVRAATERLTRSACSTQTAQRLARRLAKVAGTCQRTPPPPPPPPLPPPPQVQQDGGTGAAGAAGAAGDAGTILGMGHLMANIRSFSTRMEQLTLRTLSRAIAASAGAIKLHFVSNPNEARGRLEGHGGPSGGSEGAFCEKLQYPDLQAAVDAASSGDIVILARACSLKKTLHISKSLTIAAASDGADDGERYAVDFDFADKPNPAVVIAEGGGDSSRKPIEVVLR